MNVITAIIAIVHVFDLILAENDNWTCSTSSNRSSFQWISSTVKTATVDQTSSLSERPSEFQWNSSTVISAALDQDDDSSKLSTVKLQHHLRRGGRARNRTCRHLLRHWKDECTTTCYTRRLSTCVVVINYSWRPWRVNKILNISENYNPYAAYPDPPCIQIKECTEKSNHSYPAPPPKKPVIAPPRPAVYPRFPALCQVTAPYYVSSRPWVIPKPQKRPMYAVYCNCTTKKAMGMFIPYYASTMCHRPTTVCPYGPLVGQAQVGPIPQLMQFKTPCMPFTTSRQWPHGPSRSSKQYPNGQRQRSKPGKTLQSVGWGSENNEQQQLCATIVLKILRNGPSNANLIVGNLVLKNGDLTLSKNTFTKLNDLNKVH